jgi:hypothetical protein
VRISFDLKNDFDLARAQVYVKGQGTMYPSTECLTAGEVKAALTCVAPPTNPPLTVTPEPATILLVGAGLAGLGPLAHRRRRNRKAS